MLARPGREWTLGRFEYIVITMRLRCKTPNSEIEMHS
jgi:hypothetical protein